MELAGVVLGAFTVALELTQIYVDKAETMQMMRKYKSTLTQFHLELGVEHAIFLTTCDNIRKLELGVTDPDMTEEQKLTANLERYLGQRNATAFQNTAKTILEKLQSITKLLRLPQVDEHPVVTTARAAVVIEEKRFARFRRVWTVAAFKRYFKEEMNLIHIHNDNLQRLVAAASLQGARPITARSGSVDGSADDTGHLLAKSGLRFSSDSIVSYLLKIQQHAKTIYNTLHTRSGSCCGPNGHGTALQLETRLSNKLLEAKFIQFNLLVQPGSSSDISPGPGWRGITLEYGGSLSAKTDHLSSRTPTGVVVVAPETNQTLPPPPRVGVIKTALRRVRFFEQSVPEYSVRLALQP